MYCRRQVLEQNSSQGFSEAISCRVLLGEAGASLRLGHILDEFHFKEAISSLPG